MAKKSNLKKLKEMTKVDSGSVLKDMEKLAIDSEKWMEFANETWNIRGSDASTKAKREHVVSLHLMGISAKSILAQVNKLATVKGWTPYNSEKSIKWVISDHFKDYDKPQNLELDEHLEWVKQGMYAQQEHIIEKASLFIADKKKKWTPFEYMWALKELYAMRQQMIENKNWNDSRKNINAEVTNITNQLNVFVDNSKKIAFGQVENPALEQLKAKLNARFEQKNLEN